MAKFIKDETYNALIAARDNWNTVASHIASAGEGEGVTADNVTPQVVIDALNASGDERIAEQLRTANSRITELETENASLRDQVANLQGSAGEQSATITSTGEPKGEKENIASFADKHAGDTASILAEAKKEGLI